MLCTWYWNEEREWKKSKKIGGKARLKIMDGFDAPGRNRSKQDEIIFSRALIGREDKKV
jgi:hypothetical protein